MAANGDYRTARCREGHEELNTLRLERVDVVIDDPVLGMLPEHDVKVTYANGVKEELISDDEGVITVSAARGEYVDIAFETDIETNRLRCFVVTAAIDTDKGVWQRLVNLGYVDDPDPPSEAPDNETLKGAVQEFQVDHDFDVTGVLENEGRETLVDYESSDELWQDHDVLPGKDEEEDEMYESLPKEPLT